MLAVIAAILFAISWVLHGAGGHTGVWFNWQGVALLGLVFLALSLIWHPTIPVRKQQ